MALMWLIHEWLTRLLRIREQLGSDAAESQEWLLRVRARILKFLVSRYGALDEAPEEMRPRGREEQLMLFQDTFVAPEPEKWAGGASAAPRKSKELRESLGNIQRINACKRERWRWWP